MEKKNHHFVPQFYLRNFSNDGKSIGMFLNGKQKYVPYSSIKKTAYREYLYGENGTIENGLANNEGEWSQIIGRIIKTGKLELDGEEEYIKLLLFLTISEARTSQMADQNNAHISTLANLVIKMKLGKEKDVGVHYNIPNLISMKAAAETTPILTDLELLLIINESNRGFITSDNPVVRYNQYFMYRNYFRNYGLGQMGIQLFVPLSPRICLCVYDNTMYLPTTYDIITLRSGSQINELNKLFLLNAYERIFFNNNQKESYIKSLSKYWKEKKPLDIPEFGSKNNYIIPYSQESVKEKVKLDFFRINPALLSMPLPLHAAGPMRPKAEEYIEWSENKS